MSATTSILPRDPIAPWAEVVPHAPPARVDDLLRLLDDEWQYEVVQGVLVRMAGSGQQATALAAKLLARLFVHVEARGLGVVTGADGVYKFPHAETGLLPDVGFYRQARQTLIRDRTKPIPFAPDFAIEVASPSQGRAEMTEKARVYISNGTGEVWVFWPELHQVDIWRAEDTGNPDDYATDPTLEAVRHSPFSVLAEESAFFQMHSLYITHHPSGDMHGVTAIGMGMALTGIGSYTLRSSVVEGFTLALDDAFPLGYTSDVTLP